MERRTKGQGPKHPRTHAAPQELQKARVQWAWNAVAEAGSRKKAEEYLSEARKLPARILASGLGQSLAYLYSKKSKPACDLLYGHLSDRVAAVLGGAPVGSEGAMPQVVALSAASYRRLSRELLSSAEWLKRFAEGRLKDVEGPDGASS